MSLPLSVNILKEVRTDLWLSNASDTEKLSDLFFFSDENIIHSTQMIVL